MARTDSLTNYLTDVATAIKNKKGSQDPINASNFDTEITNLPSGGTVTPVRVRTDANIALTLEKLDNSITQAQIDIFAPCTEIVKEMVIGYNGFYNCKNITDLSGIKNIKAFNTTGTWNLFTGCSSLTTLPTIDWSTANSLNYTFGSCSSLVTIPNNYFSTIDTTVAHDLNQMFTNCYKLTDVSCLANIKPATLNKTFNWCSDLVTIPQLDLSLLGTGMTTSSKKYLFLNTIASCSSLSNDSLHNLIKSMITAPSGVYTGTKTLKNMGFDSTQATTATTFTEWATLEADGWTTGY